MLFSRRELTNPKRILLIQYQKLGEMVQSIPLLVALRTRFPFAEIAWLVDEAASKLLLGHWAVDRIILAPPHWHKSFSGIRQLREQLRLFAPEIVLDPSGTFGSSFAGYLCGAKYCFTLGDKAPRYQRFFRHRRVVPDNTVHSGENRTINRSLQLLEPFGVAGSSVGFDLPQNGADERAVDYQLHQLGLRGHFAVLNVGAKREVLRWRENRFGQLALYLLDQWNLPSLIIWGTLEEELLAQQVVATANGTAVLAPHFQLGELAAVLRRSTLCVSADTGVLHLAAALETHCVGLYGATLATQNAPFGQQNRTVQVHHQGESPFRKPLRALMDAIDTDLVCSVCDEILDDILQPKTLPIPAVGTKKKAA